MILDGMNCHENAKRNLELYADETGKKVVNPFMLTACHNTAHAERIEAFVKSYECREGRYKNKTITVHSKMRGGESEFNMRLLLDVERNDNPVDSLPYDQSYSYASSEEELDKRLEQQEKQKEEAAKNAPKLVAYDENGNEIKDRPVKFTDKSMSFEEALAEVEAEELERIQTAYKRLNRKGKAKAVELVEELTEISRYTKEDPSRDPFFMLSKMFLTMMTRTRGQFVPGQGDEISSPWCLYEFRQSQEAAP